MSDSTAESKPEPQAGQEASSDHAYFQHLERVFIALRGAPLLLAPADWQVARAWHRDGIPLALVEETLREVFERLLAAGKKERFKSLRYMKPAVTRAWRKQQEHQAAATPPLATPALDVVGRLARLARALPATLLDRERYCARIEGLTGDVETVERGLTELDQSLLEAAEAKLDEAGRAALDDALARAHQRLGVRLPAEELTRADAPLRRHVLRRLLQLPVLSLFAAEAVGDDEIP
jgi:hypothetical protein